MGGCADGWVGESKIYRENKRTKNSFAAYPSWEARLKEKTEKRGKEKKRATIGLVHSVHSLLGPEWRCDAALVLPDEVKGPINYKKNTLFLSFSVYIIKIEIELFCNVTAPLYSIPEREQDRS